MTKTSFIFFISVIPFLCFPSLYTLPFVVLCLLYFLWQGYYLESLALFAVVKALSVDYLSTAAIWVQKANLPLLIAFLFGVTFLSGWHKKIPPKLRMAALATCVVLCGISLLSEDPFLAVSKVISVYVGYQTVAALAFHQQYRQKDFLILLIVGIVLMNVAHGFQLWMPHQILENVKTNLYSGGLTHAQMAGVIYAFIALAFLIRQDYPKAYKVLLLIPLFVLLYMTHARTATLALLITLVFLYPGYKTKFFIIVLGLSVMLLTPSSVEKFIEKTKNFSSQDGRNYVVKLYSTRLAVIQSFLKPFGPREFLIGRGLGVGGYFDRDLKPVNNDYDKKVAARREKLKEKSKINLLGFEIYTSRPIEYGNIFTGAIHGVGIIGLFLFGFYFYRYFQVFDPHQKILFLFILIVNFGEAILFSPLGNPAMLLMLCLLWTFSRIPISTKTNAAQLPHAT